MPANRSVFAIFIFVDWPRDHHQNNRPTIARFDPLFERPGEMSSAAMSKKNKGKKVADPNETSKLLAAKISQLEQDAAGEKDQEAEIGV